MPSLGFINYNNVAMSIRETILIDRTHLHSDDGATYLYTRWIFDVKAVINPKALAINAAGADEDGVTAVNTDINIRKLLRTDRKRLIYQLGDEVLLRVDGTDQNNGPMVEKADIVSMHGTKTIIVRFRVVTWVNDCALSSKKNPLLSHRWKRYESIDQDYFTTLVTEGTAVFDTAALAIYGTLPDQYRSQLMHPIPFSFKRSDIQVWPDPDGTSLYYKVTDRLMPFEMSSNRGVTRAECYHTEGFSKSSGADIAAGFVGGALGDLAGGRPGGILGRAGSAITSAVPRYHSNVFCRCWGNRDATIRDVLYTAIGIALHAIEDPGEGAWNAGEFMGQVDCLGRWAEVTLTINYGITARMLDFVSSLPALVVGARRPPDGIVPAIGRLVEPFGSVVGPLHEQYTEFNLDPETPAGSYSHGVGGPTGRFVPGRTSFAFNRGVAGPGFVIQPPNSGQSRGTFLALLVHQILASSPCERPPKPPPTRYLAPTPGATTFEVELPAWPSRE